jgi:hypothetical protein
MALTRFRGDDADPLACFWCFKIGAESVSQMCEPDGNYSAPKRIDLYQLGLFNLRFRGYFYKDSVNLCPDITKSQSCQRFFAIRQALKFSYHSQINIKEGTHEYDS